MKTSGGANGLYVSFNASHRRELTLHIFSIFNFFHLHPIPEKE